MIVTYKISEQGLQRVTDESYDVLVLKDATYTEMTSTIERYELPSDIFKTGNEAESATRFERLHGTKLTNAYLLVLMDINSDTSQAIEMRLEPVMIIRSASLLIVHLNKGSNFMEHLIEANNIQLNNQAHIIGCSIYRIATHFLMELKRVKGLIDRLDDAARVTTKNQELFNLADTERLMVYLDHTLKDQRQTLEKLWTHSDLKEAIADPRFFENLQSREQHINKLVSIYRDLLETIGGLFNGMMDNNLNHLMKYLDSASLVVAIPALIAGIWGMNVGGLPVEKTSWGFTAIIIACVVLTIATIIHLMLKDYSKD